MRHSRLSAVCGTAALVAAGLAGSAGASSADTGVTHTGAPDTYLVLTGSPDRASGVAAELRSRGDRVTSVNREIGLVVVRSDDADFRGHASAITGVQGVGVDRSIGKAPARDLVVEHENEQHASVRGPKGRDARSQGAKKPRAARQDPLDQNLWGMRMIHADRAHAVTLGSPRVKVGIMDTGVQADHPDLHANFDYATSRNFVTDIESIDGPCEEPSCVDPVGVDPQGHGTHVAGTVAAAMNGYGVSGVAPRVSIVEVRAGQDSGYFFASTTANALTYAGDAGLDVVNMSFYVDPWLYNCRGGAPEDTPQQAADQDVVIETVTRALEYAHAHDVTLVGSAGNGHTDMAEPGTDTSSPDYGESPHPRTIDNDTCYSLPAEGPHVLGITALGPSERKSDFSNYTTDLRSGEVELSAPGGWFRDGFGTETYKSNSNMVLSTYPLGPLQAAGKVDKDGNITESGLAAGVIKECQEDPEPGTTPCGYFAWLQGTSMASPHATGVAALAIGEHGRSFRGSDFGMRPDAVGRLLMRSATDHACPAGRVQDYSAEGRTPDYTATCVGSKARNGFYGEGIVNAWGVVR